MTKAETKARAMIKRQTTAALILQFEITETQNDPHIPTVRGWLMDELEARNPEAFDNWMESEDDSPRQFYMMGA